jgi:putative colanic acid biosynthesis UDP-glucose lipid carrier transferase
LGFALFIFLLPMLAFVAVLIKLDSPGPVFFRQRRTGYRGVEINVLKFRTMRVMEDDGEVSQATRSDGRVTRLGSLLRRTSVDELPQLINVIRGEMSLVGPRPHALLHDQEFADLVPNYANRFRTRPGITGLAQVSGLRGEVRCHHDIVERIRLDNEYIDRWSILLDLKIMIATLFVVPFHRNAY